MAQPKIASIEGEIKQLKKRQKLFQQQHNAQERKDRAYFSASPTSSTWKSNVPSAAVCLMLQAKRADIIIYLLKSNPNWKSFLPDIC